MKLKKILTLLLVFAAGGLFSLEKACSLGFEDKELDFAVEELKKQVNYQQKIVNNLRLRYNRLLERKRELLALIEREKDRLEAKIIEMSREETEKKESGKKLIVEGKSGNNWRIDLAKDINYLNSLISKHKKLSAEINKLEIKIASVENTITILKEKRDALFSGE